MSDIDTFRECIAEYTDLTNEHCRTYSDLLAGTNPILEKQREHDRLRPSNFNVFMALGHAYREVSTHSAMLAHLLDPAASHAQQGLFLCRFLDAVQAAAERQGKSFHLPRLENATAWHCRREVQLGDGLGRADVILHGPRLLLIIENKVWAADQEGQLQHYWTYAKRKAKENNELPIIVYLTPDGRPPSSQSQGHSSDLEENMVIMSYHEDIFGFIRSSIEAVRAVSVAEILRQYAQLVRNLA